MLLLVQGATLSGTQKKAEGRAPGKRHAECSGRHYSDRVGRRADGFSGMILRAVIEPVLLEVIDSLPPEWPCVGPGFFPVWFEDVDFCRRLRERGWKITYCPEAVFVHSGGHSVNRQPFRDRQIFWYRNLTSILFEAPQPRGRRGITRRDRPRYGHSFCCNSSWVGSKGHGCRESLAELCCGSVEIRFWMGETTD